MKYYLSVCTPVSALHPNREQQKSTLHHVSSNQQLQWSSTYSSIKQEEQKAEYALKLVRAEAASANAHGRIRTCDLTVHNRVRYRCATWTCVYVLIEIELK